MSEYYQRYCTVCHAPVRGGFKYCGWCWKNIGKKEMKNKKVTTKQIEKFKASSQLSSQCEKCLRPKPKKYNLCYKCYCSQLQEQGDLTQSQASSTP